nr:inorganic pyrophosphatase [Ipomoea batatas]
MTQIGGKYHYRIRSKDLEEKAAVGGEEGREHERLDGHELDEDVQRRAGCVLERVADSVTNNGRLVAIGSLGTESSRIQFIFKFQGQIWVNGKRVGIIDDITCTPETRAPARTPDKVSTPKKIPTISGVSMTRAPGGIISLMEASVEILTQHGSQMHQTEQETQEQQIQLQIPEKRTYIHQGSGGVSCSIKGISSFTYPMTHTGHLCNASSIVTDGTICINSQTSGDGAKHSKGSNCNTIHSCKAEANKDADCYGKNRNDDRFVTQSKAKNNIGSSSSAAGISNILYGAGNNGMTVKFCDG